PFIARMRRGDENDPLLAQVLPSPEENARYPGFVSDPLSEQSFTPGRGMLHKYHGRVLVIVSGACAVNCRYCFRRHFPYNDFKPDRDDWEAIFRYVASEKTVTEVILSGGDPLVLSDKRLGAILDSLEAIPHVTTLRIHTRMPVVIPNRVCESLTDRLAASRLQVVTVIHANHPNEIDDDVGHAMAALRRAGATCLNQSVLLKGINDSADTLIRLSRRLFEVGVMPYYLHLLDPVTGTGHFDVQGDRAKAIMRSVLHELPGYLVPRLVREVPGELSKTPGFP
ncbi:MAG: EF-P beta-lysylation protein EpmB, partial [Pseudomonadales bacterium]|nr:EF-P beta-lysylation protein EpmB [Pseudomonadales bacterium]